MEYFNRGRFWNLDLIDNLGSTMLMTSELTFLGFIPFIFFFLQNYETSLRIYYYRLLLVK